jgi:hypothetical protein
MKTTNYLVLALSFNQDNYSYWVIKMQIYMVFKDKKMHGLVISC